MNRSITTRQIAAVAMMAAMYVALVMALPWLSFGPFQVRVAEALTILPVFTPFAIIGVGLGCLIANMMSPYGIMDAIVGTLASVIAGVLSYKLRGVRFWGLPILSALSPVVVNAIVIGAMLSFMYTGGLNLVVFGTYAFSVGAGQMIACVVLGLPLFKALERTSLLTTI